MIGGLLKLRPYGPDDWLVDVKIQHPSGRPETRTIGVSHDVDEARALVMAANAVRPPRLAQLGRAPTIISMRARRRWKSDQDMARVGLWKL